MFEGGGWGSWLTGLEFACFRLGHGGVDLKGSSRILVLGFNPKA